MKMDREFIKKVFEGHRAGPIGDHRFYTVLVPLVEKDDEIFLILEKRSEDVKADPGEICLPGGRMEDSEMPEECAVRETCEELGIKPEDIELIGEGNTLYGYANYTVFSRVGFIRGGALDEMEPNRGEVNEVFLLPLSFFMENEPEIYSEPVDFHPVGFPYERVRIPEDYKWRTGRWEIPVYETQGCVVWGITARIINNTVETIKRRKPDKQHG